MAPPARTLSSEAPKFPLDENISSAPHTTVAAFMPTVFMVDAPQGVPTIGDGVACGHQSCNCLRRDGSIEVRCSNGCTHGSAASPLVGSALKPMPTLSSTKN